MKNTDKLDTRKLQQTDKNEANNINEKTKH